MRTEECTNCGSSAPVVRGNCKFDEIGIPLILQHIDMVKCPNCKNVDPIIPDLDGLMDTVAVGVISSPYLLNSKEIRFLRKYLGKSQGDFAGLLRVDATTISKWENAQTQPGPQSDRLIRLVVMFTSERLEEPREKWAEFLATEQKPHRHNKPQLKMDVETKSFQYA